MIRLIQDKDFFDWIQLRTALYPHHILEKLTKEAEEILKKIEKFPTFCAKNKKGEIIGFIELSIHKNSPGCTTNNVAFIESLYVKPEYRQSGIGRLLIENGEHWAISRGCIEIASDSDPKYPVSPKVHTALGYEEVIMPGTHVSKDIGKKYYKKTLNVQINCSLTEFSIINVNRELSLRYATANDIKLIQKLMTTFWGGEPLIVNDEKYYPSKLPGFLLEQNGEVGEVQGFLFYIIHNTIYEIIVFEVFNKFTGLGTIMLNEFVQLVKKQQGTKIQVMTTNDNLDALRFYQRRGFIIQEARLNVLENSRKIKPNIPEFGDYNIPLRDEILLALSIE